MGFAKVHLDAGQAQDVEITVPWRGFAFYDVATHGWAVPRGSHALEIGFSSEDIAHTCLVEVAGDFTGHHADEPHIAYSVDSFERRLGRAIPPARPVRPYSRVSTIGEISGNPLGRLVRTAVLRFSGYHDEQDPTTAKMIERSLDEMPLRGVALLGGGKVNLGTVDGLVDLLNRRPDRMVLRLGRALIAMLPGR